MDDSKAVKILRAIVDSADSTGCSEEMTVVSASAVNAARKLVEKAERKPSNKSSLYLIVQQGGSTGEWYASTYDGRRDAEKAITAIQNASYDAIGPYEISAELATLLRQHSSAETQLIELLNAVCSDVAQQA